MPVPPVFVKIQGVDKLSGVLNTATARLTKFGKSASTVGRRMSMGLTLPIVAAGAAIFMTAANFEKSMNKVSALTQASTQDMSKMREEAKRLGIETQFSASEAADAMGFLGMAGWKTNQILKGTPALLNLAAASQTELARTADIASDIMGAFQISAKDTGHVADVLAATTASANVNLEMLAESFKDAGPVARMAGASLKDTAVAIGFLGNIGIKGTKAGTALKNMFIRLASPTGAAATMIERLGLKVADSSGNLLPYADILADLAGKMTNLGTREKIKVLDAIFGKRVIAGAAALTDDIRGVNSGFRELSESLSNVNGRAEKMAEIMMKGAPGSIKRFLSALEGLQIALGEAGLTSAISSVLIKLTGFLRKMADANPETLKWIMAILGVVAVLGPLIFIAGQVAIAIGALIPVIISLGGALMFLAANPIVLIIAAIAALVVGLVLLWKEWDIISNLWVTGVRVMAGAVVGFFRWMWEGIKGFIDKAIALLMKLLKVILMVMFPLPFLAAKLGAKFLPENIRAKIGFLTGGGEETARPADILQQERAQRSEFQGVMRFENVPPGARVEIEKGDIDLETDTGLLLGTP